MCDRVSRVGYCSRMNSGAIRTSIEARESRSAKKEPGRQRLRAPAIGGSGRLVYRCPIVSVKQGDASRWRPDRGTGARARMTSSGRNGGSAFRSSEACRDRQAGPGRPGHTAARTPARYIREHRNRVSSPIASRKSRIVKVMPPSQFALHKAQSGGTLNRTTRRLYCSGRTIQELRPEASGQVTVRATTLWRAGTLLVNRQTLPCREITL